MKSNISNAKGFTLIELIVVIVILGIMASIAGPKFVSLQTDARVAVAKGVEGAVRSAATLAYSKALIAGTETAATGTVTMAGGSVDIVYGYPAATAAGIGAAVELGGDVALVGANVFQVNSRATCSVTYTAAALNGSPTITPATGGC